MSADGRVAALVGDDDEFTRGLVDSLTVAGWQVALYGPVNIPAAWTSAPFDRGDREAVQRELNAAVRQLGPISGLIVLPGSVSTCAVDQITLELWTTQLRRDLLVTANFAWGVLSGMLADGGGNIVTVSSDLALGAGGPAAHGAAASGAVLGFTKALAIELAKTGVQVNAISAELSAHRAEAVAATATYLLNEQHFFLGQVLPVTGGRA